MEKNTQQCLEKHVGLMRQVRTRSIAREKGKVRECRYLPIRKVRKKGLLGNPERASTLTATFCSYWWCPGKLMHQHTCPTACFCHWFHPDLQQYIKLSSSCPAKCKSMADFCLFRLQISSADCRRREQGDCNTPYKAIGRT